MICTLLAFILSCTMTKMELIQENAIQIETYQTEVTSELAAEEEEQEVPSMHLYGNCRITFYDAGPCCCGAYASGITASGAPVQVNHTVANGSLPFGTRLMIDGKEYVVEDRGVGAFEIDIYVATHEEANQRGLYYSEVFIID